VTKKNKGMLVDKQISGGRDASASVGACAPDHANGLARAHGHVVDGLSELGAALAQPIKEPADENVGGSGVLVDGAANESMRNPDVEALASGVGHLDVSRIGAIPLQEGTERVGMLVGRVAIGSVDVGDDPGHGHRAIGMASVDFIGVPAPKGHKRGIIAASRGNVGLRAARLPGDG